MKIEPQGIILYPAELRALVKFSAKDNENPLSVVHFRTEGASVLAYATNGHRALQARGVAEGDHVQGEWTVFRDFLAKVLASIESQQYVALEVTGASLQGAAIRDAETLENVAHLTWHEDAATTQRTFPLDGCRKAIVLPTTERPVRCVSVNAEYLVDLALVAKAAGSKCIDLFPGKTREDPIIFRIDEFETEWMGAIMPLRKDISESETQSEEHDPHAGLFGDDVTVRMVSGDGEVVDVSIADMEKLVAKHRRDARKAGQEPANQKQPGLAFADAVLALGDEAPKGAEG